MPARLTLLRHGRAADAIAGDDAGRPLDARGREEVAACARELFAAAGRPDVCLASPALRTRQTAAILCAAPGFEGLAPTLDPSLYLAEPDTLVAAITAAVDSGKPRHVLVVGHNPGLSALATRLYAVTGTGSGPVGLGTAEFATAAVDAATWAALAE